VTYEFRFFLRDRAALFWILLTLFTASVAVFQGVQETAQQRSTLAELKQLDKTEREAVLAEQSNWGLAAYYTFHLTYDPPSGFAFAAMGERDTSPWIYRIRMLALEGQIYETDGENPDFANIGRFDFAFVVSVLSPILIILLLFDLRSGERTAGRLELIEVSARNPQHVWMMRAGIRIAAVILALSVPLWAGSLLESTDFTIVLFATIAVTVYVLFWGLVAVIQAKAHRAGSVNLAVLAGIWVLFCAVMPTAISLVSNRAVAVPEGGDIILTQREAVNDAWDLPKDTTMKLFLDRHPDWADNATVEKPFEWKWYYAFQQVGDQTAEQLSRDYREGRKKRNRLSSMLSLISPASMIQGYFEKLAGTDMTSSLNYEMRVRNFHAELRKWYYPKLFKDEPYEAGILETLPQYEPDGGP